MENNDGIMKISDCRYKYIHTEHDCSEVSFYYNGEVGFGEVLNYKYVVWPDNMMAKIYDLIKCGVCGLPVDVVVKNFHKNELFIEKE